MCRNIIMHLLSIYIPAKLLHVFPDTLHFVTWHIDRLSLTNPINEMKRLFRGQFITLDTYVKRCRGVEAVSVIDYYFWGRGFESQPNRLLCWFYFIKRLKYTFFVFIRFALHKIYTWPVFFHFLMQTKKSVLQSSQKSKKINVKFGHVTGVFHWKIFATIFLCFVADEWHWSVNIYYWWIAFI